MRFMVIVKATEDSEAGVMPSTELLAEMGNYNEELVKAGIMVGGDGLHPSGAQYHQWVERIAPVVAALLD